MPQIYVIIITALVCYFLGNHNGAVVVSKLLGDDVRSHGSGNAGLTNFIRNYGRSKALLVIAIDAGKAILACAIGGIALGGFRGMVLGGVCVMLGHDFPALLGFRGGKGILSGFFIGLMLDWRIGLLILGVFALCYFTTHYVSLGSVLAAAAFAIAFAVLYHNDVLVMSGGVFMGLLTIFMHRANIVRLVKGQERKTDLFAKGTSK